MALNRTEIALLVAELAPQFQGRELLFIRPAGAKGLVLAFGPPDERPELLIDLNAETSRLHRRRQRALPGPRTAFLDRLAAELTGRPLLRLVQPAPDRWVRLNFGGEPARALLIELMGRRSQAYLLGETGSVLARAFPVGTALQQAYEPPAPPAGAAPAARFHPPDLSAQVEAHYTPRALEAERRALIDRIGSSLRQARRRLVRRREAVQGDLAASAAAEELRQRGELLKAHLHEIRRGASEIEVRDYFSAGAALRVLKLDPKKSPREQMESCFRRARKLALAEPVLRQRLAATEAELRSLEEIEHAFAALAERPDSAPEQLYEFGGRHALLPAPPKEVRQARAARALPYRIFRSRGGQEIWVGRGAAQNEQLTFRHARGNHWWLHARGRPGSHVVIPLAKAVELDQEWLLDAAELAAQYSKSKADSLEIAYTRQRFVRKFRGARPGQVLISQEKVLFYRRDPARLQRLMESQSAEGFP
jgi:predicted ribosome quality control (RQC) complex YloA/Tae2 family protein